MGELVVRLVDDHDGLAGLAGLVDGFHHVQAQAGAGGVVGRAEEHDVRLEFPDLAGSGFGAQAVVLRALADDVFGVRSAGQQRVHGVRGREAQRLAAGPAEGLENLLEDLVGAVGGPDVLGAKPVAEVFGQGFPEFGEFPVRIAVEARGGLGHGLGDGGPDISRHAMGVLVDVEQDGDIQAAAHRRGSAPAGWSGGAVGSVAQAGHSPEQFKCPGRRAGNCDGLAGSGPGRDPTAYLDGTNSCWPGMTRPPSRLFSWTISAMTSRGSRPGSTAPAMAHSDSPGCTVTETVGVTDSPPAASAALAGEFSRPAERQEKRGQQDQRQADQDDPAAAGEPQPRRLAALAAHRRTLQRLCRAAGAAHAKLSAELLNDAEMLLKLT